MTKEEIGRADKLGFWVKNLFKYCRHYSGAKTPELIEEDIFKCIAPLIPQDERAQRIFGFCHAAPGQGKKSKPLLRKGLRSFDADNSG